MFVCEFEWVHLSAAASVHDREYLLAWLNRGGDGFLRRFSRSL